MWVQETANFLRSFPGLRLYIYSCCSFSDWTNLQNTVLKKEALLGGWGGKCSGYLKWQRKVSKLCCWSLEKVILFERNLWTTQNTCFVSCTCFPSIIMKLGLRSQLPRGQADFENRTGFVLPFMNLTFTNHHRIINQRGSHFYTLKSLLLLQITF